MILFVKKKGFDFKEPITPFIWLTALATLYELIGTRLLKLNTTYWFQLYSLLEFIALYYFFFKLFQPKYKTVFRLFLILLVITYFFSFFFWNENSSLIPKAINKTPVTLFVMVFCFICFKNYLGKTEKQSSVFYFILGFSVYYSSTFFLFLWSNFIFYSNLYFYDFWIINILATLILRIFLIAGVWKMK